jgi:serine/threonine protein kinase
VPAVTTAPFLSRPLGNFLLVAQLSEDALGTVFRAIYAPDERRFVRLRILQSPEIAPEAILSAVERFQYEAEPPVHGTLVPNAQLGLAEGVPYLAWDEVAGWTLDQLLARVRGLGVRIPPEYALLAVERIASALEFVRRATTGRTAGHGLVWPGFISISGSAEIRLGGFGLAEALLNSIHRPRIGREIAPYASPEARETGEVTPDSDVYSLGVLLTELLTGRHPRRQDPAAALTDGPSIPDELARLVRSTLEPSGQRPASVLELHRQIQELLTGSPYALYTGNLPLFLYRLLNPEGQNVRDAAEGDATNPVEVEVAEAPADAPSDRPQAAESLEDTAELSRSASESLPRARGGPRYPICLPEIPPPPAAPRKTVWIGRVGFAVAASLVAAGFLFPPDRDRPRPPAEIPAQPVAAVTVAAADTAATKLAPAAPRPAAVEATSSPAAHHSRRDARESRERAAAAALAKKSAESLRLRAALARVEAERLDAEVIARDLYAEGLQSEDEGNRLLQRGAFEESQPTLMRATQLYRMAEEVSREERVRLVRLSAAQ